MSTPANPARKIIYLSGSRADFGLMKSSLALLAKSADLSIAITGMHLASCFGDTVDDIRASDFRICGEVPLDVTTRTAASMAVGIGECLIGLTSLLQHERPDVLVLLGDRGEMLAGAIAALHLGIVCVHIHGGERSGTVDEPVRHAISKLSHYHLVATADSRERLVRMGERPNAVHMVGAPGLDGLAEMAEISADDTIAMLDLPPNQQFILAAFHPIVQEAHDAYMQACNLLLAVKRVALPVIWLEPNSDSGSNGILKALAAIGLPSGSKQLKHIKRELFSAAMKHCAVMVGNSSAGIIEAASFSTPVVNVGERQRLRERSANVTDTNTDTVVVHDAITRAILAGKVPCDNKYGDGLTGPRIVDFLTTCSLDRFVLDKSNAY